MTIPEGAIVAPFTPEQVAGLNNYQNRGELHPFTCRCGRNLLATVTGWVCDGPGCDYTQNWAWAWMAVNQTTQE